VLTQEIELVYGSVGSSVV